MALTTSAGWAVIPLQKNSKFIIFSYFLPLISGAKVGRHYGKWDQAWCLYEGVEPIVNGFYGNGPSATRDSRNSVKSTWWEDLRRTR